MKPANPRILTINGGSSSIKFALFEAGAAHRRILEGELELDRNAAGQLAREGLEPEGQSFAAGDGGGSQISGGGCPDGLDRGTQRA